MTDPFNAELRSNRATMDLHRISVSPIKGIALLLLLLSAGCATGPMNQAFNDPARSEVENAPPLPPTMQRTIQTVSYQEPIDPSAPGEMLPEPQMAADSHMESGQQMAPGQQQMAPGMPPQMGQGQLMGQGQPMGRGQPMGQVQSMMPKRFVEPQNHAPLPRIQQTLPPQPTGFNPRPARTQIYQTPMNPTYQQTDPWNVPPSHQLPRVTAQNLQTWEAPLPAYADSANSATQRAGVNVQGSEFRIPGKTATELMIDLKDENIVLRNQVAALKATIEQLNEEIRSEVHARKKVEDQLSKELHKEKLYRELIAELQVKVEVLEKENLEIEQRADKALREIEANLDSALMDSLSKPRAEKTAHNLNR